MDDTDVKKVLIIDDDEFLLEMYALKFKEAGFSVETVKDGLEAVAKIPTFKPDVILLDIVLSGMDGLAV